MDLRLRKAKLNDFEVFRKFYPNILYHWFLGDDNSEERKKAALLRRPKRVPKYDREGKPMPNATEKYAAFCFERYEKMLQNSSKEHKEYYVILEGKEVVGYILVGIECKKLRIIDFALDFNYQNKMVINLIIQILQEKYKKGLFIITVLGKWAINLLQDTNIHTIQ